jgi:hypothetical protein
VLRAARSQEHDTVLAEPLFLLLDGGQADFKRGQRYPVALKQVAGQTGAVTTTGYQYLQTGIDCKLGIREVSSVAAKLDLDLTLSSFEGYNDGAPILQTEEVKGSAYIESGGVYLVGALRRLDVEHIQSTWLNWGDNYSSQDQELQVWLRAYRIDGQAADAEGAPSDPAAAAALASAGMGESLPAGDPGSTGGGFLQQGSPSVGVGEVSEVEKSAARPPVKIVEKTGRNRLARSQPGEVGPIADRKEYAPLGGAVVGRKVDDAMSGAEWH